MSYSLILASASPRRKELLEGIGLKITIIPSGVEEMFLNNETPKKHALRLSQEKALAISQVNPDSWVIGADTIVIVGGKVLGKPKTPDEAKEMLNRLSGQAHKVITGFSIIQKRSNTVINEVVESSVIFKDISEDELNWYVKTREPFDKAGGYAIQGKAAFFIKEIHGSYTSVVGLPLCEVITILKKVGAINF